MNKNELLIKQLYGQKMFGGLLVLMGIGLAFTHLAYIRVGQTSNLLTASGISLIMGFIIIFFAVVRFKKIKRNA